MDEREHREALPKRTPRQLPADSHRTRYLRDQGVPPMIADRIAHAEKLELALSMARGVRDLIPIISDLISAYKNGGVVST